ncbi:MAG: LD-carboxypeptidase [Muribaculaceae bacterium]|nr:LD-carboxypeptidase [Muribaculaceae bacterium]MDE6540943.1 LD-carboxypeptidase [Muribaculaceae bacterium]
MKHKLTAIAAAAACISSIYAMDLNRPATIPAPLHDGDKIAILSPSGPVDSALVLSAADTLRSQGFVVEIMPHALGKVGHYAAADSDRLADLRAALTDSTVRAIMCSRGGYGAVHLLDSLSTLPLEQDPKWLIGFSDISALHALLANRGIASIHGNMCKHMALGPADDDNATMLAMLRGYKPVYHFEGDSLNRAGSATGRLLGGNLAVIADLINTPYDVIKPGTILFIEDVDEPVYKTERIIYQLRLSGVLPKLAGLIVGQFSGSRPNDSYATTEQMIADMVAPYSYPVAFNVPVGHVDHNVPVIQSAEVRLDVSAGQTVLSFE